MENLDLNEYLPGVQFYCEENAYHLMEKLTLDPPKVPEGQPQPKYETFAAFMTSYSAKPGEEVEPGQWTSAVTVVSGPRAADVVYWDYHCVTCVKQTTPAPAATSTDNKAPEPIVRWFVCDYDTKMGKNGKLVIPMELYFGFTLSSAAKNSVALLETRVRFVPGVEFLSHFRTDRRQMYMRAITKDERYKQMEARELDQLANFQKPPPRAPRIQGPSPAAAALKGECSKQQAREALLAYQQEAPKKWVNKHQNNLAAFLNTRNTNVCKSDIVGVREVGQWIKAHS